MNKIRLFFFTLSGAFLGVFCMHLYNNYKIEQKNNLSETPVKENNLQVKEKNISQQSNQIYSLTEDQKVIAFVKKNHQLPDYYITKNEAKKLGWNPSQGNLCDILPGKAIGGDYFGNREGKLPKEEKYFEADVNYNCGNRNSDRIIFTKNGEVYLTKDHYKSFEKK